MKLDLLLFDEAREQVVGGIYGHADNVCPFGVALDAELVGAWPTRVDIYYVIAAFVERDEAIIYARERWNAHVGVTPAEAPAKATVLPGEHITNEGRYPG